ncbi:MAG: sel1 repeat family protein [Chlorobiaceae bacterium]|nr:sel1 repeat family protein [Chlorobiaceae bacterium]HWR01198.1 tetratricopeptide repeat protein [Chlorobaculum sp.]
MIKKILVPILFLMMYSGTARGDERRVQMTLSEANRGDAIAQNKLGVYYEIGAGVEQNDTEAVKWFRIAADQGYGDAMFNLGEMYEQGRGVPKNLDEAIALYKKACASGGCKCSCRRYRQLTGEPEEAPAVNF